MMTGDLAKNSILRSVSASSWWLAAALVLSTATLYRIPGLPFGVGEAMLLLWLFASLPRLRLHAAGASRPLVLVTVGAVSLFCALLISGAALASRRGGLGGAALHSLAAIVFCCELVVLFCLQDRFEQRARELAITLSVVTAVLIPALFMFAQLSRLFLGWYTIFYYGGLRFSALAVNPNQFAFLMVGVPFLAASWLPGLRNGKQWSIMLGLLVLSCIGGLASLSNALRAAWALGAAIGLVGLFVLRGWRDQSSGVFTFLWIVGLAFALQSAAGMLAAVCPLGSIFGEQTSSQNAKSGNALVTAAREFFMTLPETPVAGWHPDIQEQRLPQQAREALQAFKASHIEQQQLAERRTLWRYGIEAIARAPVLGNGPGHFSGLNGPFEGKEAHNTLIDWTASTGAVGLMVLVAWAGFMAHWFWRRRSLVGLAGFAALVFLAQFHFVMRQPIFWFVLLTLAALPANAARRTVDGQET